MNELAKLKDIKPPVNIDTTMQELVIYAGAGVGLLIIAILVVLLYLFLFKKKRRKLSKEELALMALNSIDFNNTKDAVYTFSVNAQKLVSSQDEEELNNLLNSLQKYKYKKDVAKLSSSDIERMKKFIKKLKAKKKSFKL